MNVLLCFDWRDLLNLIIKKTPVSISSINYFLWQPCSESQKSRGCSSFKLEMRVVKCERAMMWYVRGPVSEWKEEGLSSQQRKSGGAVDGAQCLGISCTVLLRPMITLSPVFFKSSNNRRREEAVLGIFSQSPARMYLPCKQHQWLESRSIDATQWKDPCKVTMSLWQEKWKVMSLPCTPDPCPHHTASENVF